MRNLAIATVRKIVCEHQKRGLATWCSVAKSLEIKPMQIRAFVKSISKLDEELQIKGMHDRYHWAIDLLQKNGLIVTVRRVAILTRVKSKAVTMWRSRQKQKGRHYLIVDQHSLGPFRVQARLLWLEKLAHRSLHCRFFTVEDLANHVGYTRTAFFRLMQKNPHIRESCHRILHISSRAPQ